MPKVILKLFTWKNTYIGTWVVILIVFNPLKGSSWSFDEVMGGPGRWIEAMQGKPQAQAPLPVPRNEMPPVGNNASIEPCAAPPPPVAQYRQVQIAQEAPVTKTASRIQIVKSVGQGQTLAGLMDRVQADDAWYDPNQGRGWVLVFNSGQQKYTLIFDRQDKLIAREVK